MDLFRHHPANGVALLAEPVAQDELSLAVRAVLVHTAQQWPGGVYCNSDRSAYPCRLRRWGERVLLSAGWQEEDIAAMVRRAEAGVPPWLAGLTERPPR